MDRLLSREELIAQGYPFGKVDDNIPFGDYKTEWMRSKPDVKVFIPESELAKDCDNCVLAVLPTPDEKELLAIWTQSSCEGFGDNRIVIARSEDGEHWSKPMPIIGAIRPGERQCSWGMPMYTKSGRLYLFFTRIADRPDLPNVASGDLALVYSDDDGKTWSDFGIAPMPRCQYDHPDPTVAKNWWSFQAPIRDTDGKYITGFTIETSPAVLNREYVGHPDNETRVAFLRFENLDDDPEPQDVRVSILPNDGLEVPHKTIPERSVAQEPDPVLLPDGRLFATMRTMSGYMCYTVGKGDEWRTPQPVIGWDGNPVPHPLGPCPVYALEGGIFLCLTNLNSGQRLGYDVFRVPKEIHALNVARGPLYLMAGKFDPNGEQPIRFGKPVLFIDTDTVALGQRKKSCTAPVYTAVTQWHGKTMLWYPDRKFQILGKEIKPELLEELTQGL